jgi:hypothetical protein
MIKSGRMRWVVHLKCMGEKYAYRVLVRKPEGKKSLLRPRYMSEDNVKVDLRKI